MARKILCVDMLESFSAYKYHGSVLRHRVIQDWSETDDCLDTWGRFLRGEIPHPGMFELHAIPLDAIEASGAPFGEKINTYLLRAIDAEVFATSEEIFVYAKMMNFLTLGFVKNIERTEWSGTRVGVKGGVLGRKNYTMPKRLWKLIDERSRIIQSAYDDLSVLQKDKINGAIYSDPEKSLGSGTFEAAQFDLALRSRTNQD